MASTIPVGTFDIYQEVAELVVGHAGGACRGGHHRDGLDECVGRGTRCEQEWKGTQKRALLYFIILCCDVLCCADVDVLFI